MAANASAGLQSKSNESGYFVFRSDYIAEYRKAHPNDPFNPKLLYPLAKAAFKALTVSEKEVGGVMYYCCCHMFRFSYLLLSVGIVLCIFRILF